MCEARDSIPNIQKKGLHFSTVTKVTSLARLWGLRQPHWPRQLTLLSTGDEEKIPQISYIFCARKAHLLGTSARFRL